jgi:hypothetical protein
MKSLRISGCSHQLLLLFGVPFQMEALMKAKELFFHE